MRWQFLYLFLLLLVATVVVDTVIVATSVAAVAYFMKGKSVTDGGGEGRRGDALRLLVCLHFLGATI